MSAQQAQVERIDPRANGVDQRNWHLDFARRVRALGNALGPAALDGSQALLTPMHETEPYRGVRVMRDSKYGPHERHRLDVFTPDTAGGKRPVFVFVHGGGFARGDKKTPGSPYLDNVGVWAVRNGMVGVNITYRYAPEFMWPSGAEDVAAAIAWIRANVASHGGDPARVFLAGTSAGAVHVASYIAFPQFHKDGIGIVGGILLSGIYDFTVGDHGQLRSIYFGDDASRYASQSSINGLVETKLPWLLAIAEHDPPEFERQALGLIARYQDRHGHWPNFVRLMGHNHYTAAFHLNNGDDALARPMLDFMARV